MINDYQPSEWLSPMEALELLEPRYGAGTKTFIADKLKDGLIDSHAELMWESSEPSLDAAWKNRRLASVASDGGVEHDVVLEKRIWRSSRHWAWDIENWRWPENRFVITRRKNPADRLIITGLKLWKKDVLNLLLPPSKRSGKKPNYVGYAHMFRFFLELERAGGLTIEKLKNKAALESQLLTSMATSAINRKEILDEETMKRCAWATWDLVIGPQK